MTWFLGAYPAASPTAMLPPRPSRGLGGAWLGKPAERKLLNVTVGGIVAGALVLGAATLAEAANFDRWKINATVFEPGLVTLVSCNVRIFPAGTIKGTCGNDWGGPRIPLNGKFIFNADGTGSGRFKLRGTPACPRVSLARDQSGNTLTALFTCPDTIGHLIGVRLGR